MKIIGLIAVIGLVAISGFVTRINETYTVSTKESKLTWTGKRVNYGHTGSVDLKSGKLVFENETLIGGSFVIDMVSIRDLDLEDEKRAGRLVGHLKSEDFFDVEKFPETLFEITSVKKEATEFGNYIVSGNLTIRGKTNLESFPAQITVSENQVIAKGTVTFDRTKYNVRYGSGSFFDDLGDKMIHDEIQVAVELVAKK